MPEPRLTDLSPAIAEAVASASGFIFDMDGTIALGDGASGGHRALPHATELLAAIKARGIPVRVFTNGTAKPPAAYAASLRAAGFDLDDAEMMTPSSSAAAWFVRRGIGRVRVLGNRRRDGAAARCRASRWSVRATKAQGSRRSIPAGTANSAFPTWKPPVRTSGPARY